MSAKSNIGINEGINHLINHIISDPNSFKSLQNPNAIRIERSNHPKEGCCGTTSNDSAISPSFNAQEIPPKVDILPSKISFPENAPGSTVEEENTMQILTLHKLSEYVNYITSNPIVDLAEIQELPSRLNEALHKEPCYILGQYQLRIMHLRKILHDAQRLPSAQAFILAIKQRLIYAEQAAEALYQHSITPVQDSLWPLYDRILRLTGIEPDYFSTSVASLHEKSLDIGKNDLLAKNIQDLLPRLLPPSHYLWNQSPPYTDALQQLEDIQRSCKFLLNHMKRKTSMTNALQFRSSLESIFEFYNDFMNHFRSASEEVKEEMIMPKAQLSVIGLGIFLLDQKVVRNLISSDESGKVIKTNQFGTHAVCHKEGVFYKANSIGRNFIGPEREFAIYAMYHLLGQGGISPTALAKVNNVTYRNQNSFNSKILQVGYGVKGISLQDLLGMNNVLPFLDRCLGQKTEEIFFWLLEGTWEDEFLKEYPHLSYYSDEDDSDEDEDCNSPTLEEQAEQFIREYEKFFSTRPRGKRCREFITLPVTNATRQDFYIHITYHSTRQLIRALAVLQYCPDLSTISSKDGLHQTSFTEITDLCLYIEKIKQFFPTLSPQLIKEELSQLMNRFDLSDFSTHFLVSILSNPCDHKSDNLMVRVQKNESGGVESLYLIGIDNDLAFTPHEDSVRTILYLLEPMQSSFNLSIAKNLLNTTPEGTVVNWLVALEEQNQRYDRWIKQGILTQNDLFEDGEETLKIPMTIDENLLPVLYQKITRIIQLLIENPTATHWDILRAVQPRIAQAYEIALNSSDTIEQAYFRISTSFAQGERISHSIISRTPAEASLIFLNTIDLLVCPLDVQVSLIGKAMRSFPSLLLTNLPKDAYSNEFFLLAVEQGHRALVNKLLIEDKQQRSEDEETLPLSESRNRFDQTPLLVACNKLDWEMIQFLINWGVDSHARDINEQTTLSLCLQHFTKSPEQVIAAIQFLGNNSNVFFNAVDNQKLTLLHRMVDFAAEFPDEAELLIDYLIEKGANPDLIDNRGLTALDLAMEKGDERLVIQLIKLGAGRVLNVKLTLTFFDSRDLHETFDLLQNNSMTLRWYLAMQSLNQSSSEESNIKLTGAQLGNVKIPNFLMGDLFAKNNDLLSQMPFGRRKVCKIRMEGRYDLYFKQYPEMPGIEYAVGKLFELLIGHGTSPTDLAKVTFPNGKSYPVLISQGINGDNLHDVLSDTAKAQRLNKLDHRYFSELLLASFIVNFEDAKPENFILEPLNDESFHLVGIDNDHAFVRENTLIVKSILYCFDSMKQPLHPCARERFLSLDPEQLLNDWLKLIDQQNILYCNLFPPDNRKMLLTKPLSRFISIVPVLLRSGIVVEIYNKLCNLQDALKGSIELTGFAILSLVSPNLGKFYEETFQVAKTPIDRFRHISNSKYTIDKSGRYQTIITTQQLLKLMNITESAAWSKEGEQSLKLVKQELKNLHIELQLSSNVLNQIRDELQAGNLLRFKSLHIPIIREKVFNGLRGVFEGINFDEMKLNGKNDISRQKKVVLDTLEYRWRNLCFNGCDVFNRSMMKKFIKNSPQVNYLKFKRCPLIDDNVVNILGRVRYLTHLVINDIPRLKQVDLPLLSIKRIQISGCKGLQQLTISNKVKFLYLSCCPLLSNIMVKHCEVMSYYLFWSHPQFTKEITDFSLKTLYIKDCPQLPPWNLIFKDWLTIKQHCIFLQDVPLQPKREQVGSIVKGVLDRPKNVEMLSSLFAYFEVDFIDALHLGLCYTQQLEPLIYIVNYYSRSQQIQNVDLKQCDWITDIGLHALAIGCPELRTINLRDCSKITTEGLAALLLGCPQLSSIDMKGCNNITEGKLISLAFEFPKFRAISVITDFSWSELKLKVIPVFDTKSDHLDLSNCSITNGGLESLIKVFPTISSLNLQGCSKISDEALINLARKAPNLLSISLRNCKGITDRSLSILAQECLNLRYFNIGVPIKVTNAGLTALHQLFPHLHINGIKDSLWKEINCKLQIAFKENFEGFPCIDFSLSTMTDQELLLLINTFEFHSLVEKCNQFAVNFKGSTSVTDGGIYSLLSECSQVSVVNVSNCPKITNHVFSFVNQFPLVKILQK